MSLIRQQSGFSMIELLISLVILSVGLLGTAAIQSIGLRTASVALNHNTATQLSVEIIERMRINKDVLEAGGYDGEWDETSAETMQSPECSPCTADQQASLDLYKWVQKVTDLNQGSASISYASGTVTVTIEWVDVTFGGEIQQDAAGEDISGSDGEEQQSFVLSARMS